MRRGSIEGARDAARQPSPGDWSNGTGRRPTSAAATAVGAAVVRHNLCCVALLCRWRRVKGSIEARGDGRRPVVDGAAARARDGPRLGQGAVVPSHCCTALFMYFEQLASWRGWCSGIIPLSGHTPGNRSDIEEVVGSNPASRLFLPLFSGRSSGHSSGPPLRQISVGLHSPQGTPPLSLSTNTLSPH
jgi:hypothetical protein